MFTCRLGLKVDFVKVLDLGLVKGSATGEGSSDTDLTVEGAVPGSPAFMAPEAIRGQEKLDGKTDLYSLGCVAFWLLTGRKGAWRPEPRIRVVTVFGGAEFDFREAKLQPGMTEINCRCVFGGAKIIVPPGLHVQMDGVGVMGAFTDSGDMTEAPEDDAPWLKITGFAVFGGVEIEVKGPHQSLGDRLRKLLPG